MKKRVLVAMLAGLLPLCASAWVSSQPFNKRFYISVPDTIAKQDTAKMDLEDLEAIFTIIFKRNIRFLSSMNILRSLTISILRESTVFMEMRWIWSF